MSSVLNNSKIFNTINKQNTYKIYQQYKNDLYKYKQTCKNKCGNLNSLTKRKNKYAKRSLRILSKKYKHKIINKFTNIFGINKYLNKEEILLIANYLNILNNVYSNTECVTNKKKPSNIYSYLKEQMNLQIKNRAAEINLFIDNISSQRSQSSQSSQNPEKIMNQHKVFKNTLQSILQ